MYVCPECTLKLLPARTAGIKFWNCPNCLGHLFGFGALKKLIGNDGASSLWRASERVPAQGRPCPSCRQQTRVIFSEHQKLNCEVDVCRPCHAVWLDSGEDARLRPARIVRPAVHKRPEQMREYSKALLEMHSAKKLNDDSFISREGPNDFWKYLPALAGLPVEMENRPLSRRPWVTWLAALFCTLIYFKTASSAESIVQTFGFLPADPLRSGGVTWLTSFFLHGGLLHLIGNMYYLLIFSDDAERELSHAGFIFLLFGSHIAGVLAHMNTTGTPDIPLVGASGGVFGVLAYYMVRFPRAKVGLMYLVFFRAYWIRMSAIWLILLKVLSEVLLSRYANGSNVAHAAHVGGALFGAVIGLVFNSRDTTDSEPNTPGRI